MTIYEFACCAGEGAKVRAEEKKKKKKQLKATDKMLVHCGV